MDKKSTCLIAISITVMVVVLAAAHEFFANYFLAELVPILITFLGFLLVTLNFEKGLENSDKKFAEETRLRVMPLLKIHREKIKNDLRIPYAQPYCISFDQLYLECFSEYPAYNVNIFIIDEKLLDDSLCLCKDEPYRLQPLFGKIPDDCIELNINFEDIHGNKYEQKLSRKPSYILHQPNLINKN